MWLFGCGDGSMATYYLTDLKSTGSIQLNFVRVGGELNRRCGEAVGRFIEFHEP